MTNKQVIKLITEIDELQDKLDNKEGTLRNVILNSWHDILNVPTSVELSTLKSLFKNVEDIPDVGTKGITVEERRTLLIFFIVMKRLEANNKTMKDVHCLTTTLYNGVYLSDINDSVQLLVDGIRVFVPFKYIGNGNIDIMIHSNIKQIIDKFS